MTRSQREELRELVADVLEVVLSKSEALALLDAADRAEELEAENERITNADANTDVLRVERDDARRRMEMVIAENAALRADNERLRGPESIGDLPPASELAREGGRWLGAAREWVQRKKLNGERVTWGSADVLEPPMTMRQVEDVAAEAAAGALRDRWQARKQLEDVRSRSLRRDCELTHRAERAEAERDRLRAECERLRLVECPCASCTDERRRKP